MPAPLGWFSVPQGEGKVTGGRGGLGSSKPGSGSCYFPSPAETCQPCVSVVARPGVNTQYYLLRTLGVTDARRAAHSGPRCSK